MAWGTPTFLAHNKTPAAAGAHSVVASGINASVGDILVASGMVRAAVSTDTILISDSAGNTWTMVQQPATNAASINQVFMAWTIVTSALAGGTVTIEDTATVGTTFNRAGLSVSVVSGGLSPAPEDATTRAQVGAVATTTPSLTSGSPTQADEMMFSVWGALANTTSTSFVEDGTWTALDTNYGDPGGSSRGHSQSSAFFENTGSGTKARSPSTASLAYGMITMGFKIAAGGGGATPVHRLTALGVG